MSAIWKPCSVSGDGEAHTVNCDTAFLDDVAAYRFGGFDADAPTVTFRVDADDRPDRVDVTLHDMPVKPPVRPHGAFQVHL